MSQLKVDTIRHTGASSDAIILASDGTATVKITNYPHRNLIINGAMQIAQRGTSSTDGNYKTLDRWKHNHGGTDENPTYAQIDLDSSDTGPWAKGFRKAFKITNGNQTSGAGADDYVQVMQAIEAQNIAQSGWDYTSSSSYITISFWIKSSVEQAFAGHLRTVDGTSKSYSFSTGSLNANTWTKVTKTIPGASGLQFDNDNAAGLYFYIFGFMGTNLTSTFTTESWANASSTNYANDMTSTWWTTNDATLAITGVQLEVGDTATNFEHRSYGDELLRCQRYFWQVTKIGSTSDVTNKPVCPGNYISSSEVRFLIDFPVTMRAQPTHSSNDNNNSWYFNHASSDLFDRFDMYSATEQRAMLRNSAHMSGTAGNAGMAYQESGDSTLSFSAEL